MENGGKGENAEVAFIALRREVRQIGHDGRFAPRERSECGPAEARAEACGAEGKP